MTHLDETAVTQMTYLSRARRGLGSSAPQSCTGILLPIKESLLVLFMDLLFKETIV